MRPRIFIALFLAAVITSISAINTTTAFDSLAAFTNASRFESVKKLTADELKKLVESVTQNKTDRVADNNKGESK